MEITEAQAKILEVLDSLKPYERIEIVADKMGKPETFLIIRQSKMLITMGVVTYL